MSDAAGAPRAWIFYLDDMIGFAEKVLAYTDGLDQDGFIRDGLVYDATLRNLRTDRRSRHAHPRDGARRQSRCPLATRRRHPQPVDPRLSRHRQRHPLEHRPG